MRASSTPGRTDPEMPRRLTDEELAAVAGASATVLSNLANLRHESLKAVAQNLRA